MKKAIFLVSIIFVIASCTQKSKESEEITKIENTLKSVSLLYDSLGIDPSELLSMFERINKAIDSIGYPDAGYKLWIIQSDSTKDFRFMLEGYWPNQAIYDTIHKNELYLNAWNADDKKVWSSMKNISYNRFLLVK
ncbi:MAG: hypothetical protein A2X05_12705 [Bacteroidetes bacterium GWE2_41_25]|nr:MAG: hypothetical protein A2X05_12705 [Bacteroidetes bacterium GWE2_41_25]